MYYPRNLKRSLLDAVADTPVLMVNGARQTGKSTLIQRLTADVEAPRYVTLDDLTTLDSALRDPQGFIERLPERVIIDEIQRVPELMLPIKYSVDRNRKPGRFLLTGSANVLSLPKVADTLVGRIEIHTLWPLSQGEAKGVQESFVDTICGSGQLTPGRELNQRELIKIMLAGGYPDTLDQSANARRRSWFNSYITTLIERDVRDLQNISQLTVMPKLLQLLASRAGGLLNYSDIARSLEVSLTTLKTYMALLHALFIIVPLQPWFGNIGKRLVKAPKIYLNDTGLLCHLLNRDSAEAFLDGSIFGKVLENFVIMELVKQISWSNTVPRIYHFRTERGDEVDIVLETRDGRIVGIECKGGVRIGASAFGGLKALRELTGKNFHRGIVLYCGPHILPFEEQFQAVPISALWETNSGASPPFEP